MFLLISLLLVAQTPTSDSRWDYPDVLIEDSLGPMVAFAADYNYTTGDIYVAAAVDSGYFGDGFRRCLIFRSQDHGLTWDTLSNFQLINGWDIKNVDLVVTRNDTLYLTLHRYSTSGIGESIIYFKIYGGSITPLAILSTTNNKFLSPVLVRDDFDPFYLYRAYIIDCGVEFDTIRFERSTDKGTTWTNVYNSASNIYNDCDLTVSDSTLYCTYLYYTSGERSIRTRVYRDRGEALGILANIHSTSDTINANIEYPRIGATTTTPDNGQLVYTLFSQRNAVTEEWDLLYKHSVDGGNNWSSDIDTIVQGSTAGVISDIRGYEVAPNQYMDITYCVVHVIGDPIPLPLFNTYWRWSSEGAPTNWHDTTDVSGGLFGSIPEIVYSPGASATGSGVVYNDFSGSLYFDAPWYSGIVENPKGNEDKTRSVIVLPGSVVKLNSTGSIVYDLMGREVTKLNNDNWDLKNAKGAKVNCGIYFILNENTGEKVKVLIPIK